MNGAVVRDIIDLTRVVHRRVIPRRSYPSPTELLSLNGYETLDVYCVPCTARCEHGARRLQVNNWMMNVRVRRCRTKKIGVATGHEQLTYPANATTTPKAIAANKKLVPAAQRPDLSQSRSASTGTLSAFRRALVARSHPGAASSGAGTKFAESAVCDGGGDDGDDGHGGGGGDAAGGGGTSRTSLSGIRLGASILGNDKTGTMASTSRDDCKSGKGSIDRKSSFFRYERQQQKPTGSNDLQIGDQVGSSRVGQAIGHSYRGRPYSATGARTISGVPAAPWHTQQPQQQGQGQQHGQGQEPPNAGGPEKMSSSSAVSMPV